MTLPELDLSAVRFRTSDEVLPELRAACEANPDLAAFEVIGESEQGRPIAGVRLGIGPRLATLVAGAHADEPVGPETLRTLVIEGLAARGWGAEGGGLDELLQRWTLRVVPHVNPDGEARNRSWIDAWPDPPGDHGAGGEPFSESLDLRRLRSYLVGRRREPPGRDVEFGYAGAIDGEAFGPLRAENAAAETFLFSDGAPRLHASLHGIGYAEGALLLIERDWLADPATAALRDGYARAAREIGLGLHDHDRHGDKGFVYGGPGFWSTPRGAAMRRHFLDADDPDTAALFRLSSMERAARAAAERGADPPLSIVTELPLFVVSGSAGPEPGVATNLARFNALKSELLGAAAEGLPLVPVLDAAGVRVGTVGLRDAVRVHLRTLELALDAAEAERPGA